MRTWLPEREKGELQATLHFSLLSDMPVEARADQNPRLARYQTLCAEGNKHCRAVILPFHGDDCRRPPTCLFTRCDGACLSYHRSEAITLAHTVHKARHALRGFLPPFDILATAGCKPPVSYPRKMSSNPGQSVINATWGPYLTGTESEAPARPWDSSATRDYAAAALHGRFHCASL